ncbi:MAG: GEVED domain-containing protein, partial [Cytophagales bacterium]|nr:GEVED domain-containing protein [Cytophagales bacterium]
LPLYIFGKYDWDSKNWDLVMYNAPYYLMVNSAGNLRGQQSQINNKGGYDLLSGQACSKNSVTVAAVRELYDYSSPNQVILSDFSSFGPTDDGRIKPDLSAKGVHTYSSTSENDEAYSFKSGTSMASPSVAGSLLLLQQHFSNLYGRFMRASTLKGLAIHTADEAGASEGPDYRFGWGLMNSGKAAQVLSGHGGSSYLSEEVLDEGGVYEKTFLASGDEPLKATICWTDPDGEILGNIVDLSTPALVNDLDLRLSWEGEEFLPWRLDPDSPEAPASRGDNRVDPVEHVAVNNPEGVYTIRVSHKGALKGERQAFSLIVSGITGPVCEAPVPRNIRVVLLEEHRAVLEWEEQGAESYWAEYRKNGEGSWKQLRLASNQVSLEDLQAGESYEFRVRASCGLSFSGYSEVFEFTTLAPPSGYCDVSGSKVVDEFIAQVELANEENTSAGAVGGYSDFTDVVFSLDKNKEYSLTVLPGWQSAVYAEGFAAWIDFNQDQEFSEEEKILSAEPSRAEAVRGNFIVPEGAPEGETRMRVAMQFETVPEACRKIDYGETEDYTVRIGNGNSTDDMACPTVPQNLALADLKFREAKLVWNRSKDDSEVNSYELMLNETIWGTLSDTVATVEGLDPQNRYWFRVRAKDGAGNISLWSDTLSVITPALPDVDPPEAPKQLQVSMVTGNSVRLSWDASNDDRKIRYVVWMEDKKCDSVETKECFLKNLEPKTTYKVSVEAVDEEENRSPPSEELVFNTLEVMPEYCRSEGKNARREWIERVELGSSINKSGPNGGYGDYTHKVIPVVYGANIFRLEAGFAGALQSVYWKAWLDFDKNGEFGEDEAVLEGPLGADGIVEKEFTIPLSAAEGLTRLRISMKYYAVPYPCSRFVYGEVEDYTVEIRGSGTRSKPVLPMIISPHPVTDKLKLVAPERQIFTYQIFALNGTEVLSGKLIEESQIDVRALGQGIYLLVLVNESNAIVRRFLKK